MDISSDSRRRVLFLILVLITGGATGLRDVRITVPAMVRSRDSALLSCDYDLEGADLYSIKWYHEEEEFYRFVPKEAPPQAIFAVRDIQIDSQHSNTRDVTLVNVSRKLTGRYRCEISADAPSFHTVIKTAPMLVVDVPETDPSIQPERQRLPGGETLRANCTSGASSPAPTVTWAVNGDPLNRTKLSHRTRSRLLGHGDLQATLSMLELETSGELFKDGKLVLRCFAAISTVYTASAELVVDEDTPLLAPITGDASTHLRRSSGCGVKSSSEMVVLFASLASLASWSR
ncbi:uncharacterized protein LOC105683032 isoform X1 [Athalia rosae]|uniref:uncharacterized protein LOC105683032 isoform X1 n=1 Tax=Athalia rosae TaxID=37344 RepID=UPI0020344616|nr:uncharacterized protein LOC105683032 isoform X1 [Athalia rosae]